MINWANFTDIYMDKSAIITDNRPLQGYNNRLKPIMMDKSAILIDQGPC